MLKLSPTFLLSTGSWTGEDGPKKRLKNSQPYSGITVHRLSLRKPVLFDLERLRLRIRSRQPTFRLSPILIWPPSSTHFHFMIDFGTSDQNASVISRFLENVYLMGKGEALKRDIFWCIIETSWPGNPSALLFWFVGDKFTESDWPLHSHIKTFVL